jgi:hypothetical protein
MYFSPKNNSIFTNDIIKCEKCKSQDKVMAYLIYWRKKDFTEILLCGHCIDKKLNQFGIVVEKKLIIVTDKLPSDSVPIFLRPPTLQHSKRNISVFEAADRQLDNEVTIDRTKLAGRETIFGARIGSPDMKLLKEKDEELTLKKGLNLLDDLKDAKRT